ncbi:MAG TPA: alpha/beta hydrolase, partial [Kofleriaceae bacterium]|nr:alpha/beta hydrolase [Kofleriaceae bacterium]
RRVAACLHAAATGTSHARPAGMLKAIAIVIVLLVPSLALSQAPPAKTPAPTAKKAPATKAPTAKPSIVLVHGAWADGSSWDKVSPLLMAKGYNVVAVHLPMTSPADDVAAVNRAIDRMPGDVVLVAHSYGGFVISEAGNNKKVKKLVFVDAFGLDDGESLNALTKGNHQPFEKTLQVDSGGYAWMPIETIMSDFVPDMPADEQKLVFVKQAPISVKAFDEVMKNPAWKTKKSWYVRGTQDRIIPPDAQAMMAKRMKATTVNVDAGHVSMLAKPNEVAAVILQAAGAPTATASK